MMDVAAAQEPDSQEEGLGESTFEMIDSSARPWVRDDELYFEDGNIVVAAESTIFRLHRGILSFQSDIFRDLFAIPQPAQVDTVDGCPLVCLQESAYEMKWLFLAIYKGAGW